MNTERENGGRGMETIKCCKDCSKKQVGCHSSCADYIIEKAFYEAQREERTEKNLIRYGLYNQRDTVFRKYFKATKKGPGYRA
jgi:hypothetical protein